MPEPLLNFAVVVFVQFLIFATCAFYEKKLSDAPRVLGLGVLMGVVFGIPFDLIFGKFFHFHSYALGFGISFLSINAAFSYGLFAANTLLLQQARLQNFLLWISALAVVYEIANHFFRVWTWEFTLPPVAFLPVVWVGYLVGAFVGALIWHILLGRRFVFLDNLFQK